MNPGSYYRDLFTDTDGDGIHNFPDGTEIMGFNCSFIMGLRWDDWVVNATDYDARIHNQQGQLVGVSEDTQGNGCRRWSTRLQRAVGRDRLPADRPAQRRQRRSTTTRWSS